MESCRHYVVVDQYRPLLVQYDRASGWRKTELGALTDVLDLPAIDAALPLAGIYDGVDLTARTTRRRPAAK